jgi:lysozyme
LGLDYDDVRAGKQELDDRQIDELLAGNLDTAIADCQALFPGFSELSDVRQRVLADMMFNLGRARLAKFKKLIARVKEKDFAEAADEMKNSKWYREVKKRGETLVMMIRSNADPD